MNIAIGSDHGGYDLKEILKPLLEERGVNVIDVGCSGKTSVDYPDFAGPVGEMVSEGKVDRGVVICTTGIGASITANKYPGVRAALCLTPHMAGMARKHNNANVLALGAANTTSEEAVAILWAWFDAEFEGGRHERRVEKIESPDLLRHKFTFLDNVDHAVFDSLKKEIRRKDISLNLIASENSVSVAVRAAGGSVLAGKYASGYPSARHYPGCSNADEVERLAKDRIESLFGAEHANVQCSSGSSANMAVFLAALEHGDTILSMSPRTGGHITHGGDGNLSGRLYNPVYYQLDPETGIIDYDQVRELAREYKPRLICVGDSVYSRFINFKQFREIADTAGAYLMADIAHTAGLIVAGCYPNPVPYCEFVTLTTHKTLRGPHGGAILCQQRFADNIDQNVYPGIQGGPAMNVIAAKAVCFYEASQPEFKIYQQQVVLNAKALAEEFEHAGLYVLSGGTDTHMMTIDISKHTDNPKAAALALEKAGILVNYLDIPMKPGAASGSALRIGTADITSRNMDVSNMKQVYEYVKQALAAMDNSKSLAALRVRVASFMKEFPSP